MAPFASKLIVEYLGGEEEELLNAIIEHLRAHKSAADLVEELEPVRSILSPFFRPNRDSSNEFLVNRSWMTKCLSL